jgi:hypothetical protein
MRVFLIFIAVVCFLLGVIATSTGIQAWIGVPLIILSLIAFAIGMILPERIEVPRDKGEPDKSLRYEEDYG